MAAADWWLTDVLVDVVLLSAVFAAPAPPAAQRKRKKAGSDGGSSAGAAAAGPSASPPPAAKKARVAGPKAKAGKADKGQDDAGEPVARDEARGELSNRYGATSTAASSSVHNVLVVFEGPCRISCRWNAGLLATWLRPCHTAVGETPKHTRLLLSGMLSDQQELREQKQQQHCWAKLVLLPCDVWHKLSTHPCNMCSPMGCVHAGCVCSGRVSVMLKQPCTFWQSVFEKPSCTACWLEACFICQRAVVPAGCPAGADAADDDRAGKVHTGVFSKDLPWLMYGCGDADKPLKVKGSARRAYFMSRGHSHV